MVHWFHPKAAQTLVLVHGFTGSVAVWAKVASHLPKHLGVAALPLPGHHPQAPAEGSFEATCDALAQVVSGLQCASVHLVGYSLGARLSLGIALRHPSLVAGVSLIGGHVGLQSQQARLSRKAQDDGWVRMLRDEGIERFVAAWEAQPIFASQTALASRQLEAQRHHRLRHDPEALAASLERTGLGVMPNLWPELKNNTVPMQLIVGSQDAKFVALLQRVERATPLAYVRRVEGCGHNVVLEAPAALAALLCATCTGVA